MERIKIVIVEDEFVIAEDISTRLAHNGYEVLAVFDQAETALRFILEKRPDLIVVDIRLNGPMDGIEMVELIQKEFRIPVIYITANSDAATYERARRTHPHAFLIKPFTPANLLAVVDLALYNFSSEQSPESIQRKIEPVDSDAPFLLNQSLFIRTSGKHKKICPNDILFVEAAGSYVNIQTVQERFTLTQNLSNFLKKNPIENILRVHRSYLVNLTKVDSFDESFLFIGVHKLPISESYKEEFMAKIHCL